MPRRQKKLEQSREPDPPVGLELPNAMKIASARVEAAYQILVRLFADQILDELAKAARPSAERVRRLPAAAIKRLTRYLELASEASKVEGRGSKR